MLRKKTKRPVAFDATDPPQLHRITTDDEAVGIKRRFKGLHRFIEKHPKLGPLADNLYERLCSVEPALGRPDRPDLGGWPALLYLRSSFSTDLHPLFIASQFPQDQCLRYLTARQNWFSGLHPLPKVIDALYGRLRSGCRQQVRVDVDFSSRDYDGMRAVAVAGDRAFEGDPTWSNQHVMLRVSRDASVRDGCGSNARSIPVFPQLEFTSDEDRLKPDGRGAYPLIRDFEIWNRLFHANSPMSISLIAGAARLCAHLRVPANLMMFRAIAGGVFSIWRYPQFDDDDPLDQVVTTLLCRPGNAAAVSAGVILFGRGPNPTAQKGWKEEDLGPARNEESIGKIRDELREWSAEIEHIADTGQRRASTGGGVRVSDQANDEVSSLLKIDPGDPDTRYAKAEVGQAIAHLAGMRLREEAMRGLGNAICRLLERAILLSDTTDEGRPISFGLMLGDPFHIRYWPGARPSPIVEPIGDPVGDQAGDQVGDPGGERRQHSLSIDRLRARIEYVSDPRLRCIVFPYFATYPRGGDGDNDPSYVIDLSEFGPSVASWPPSTLWSPEASNYAYLSAQCPGSIACLVGPGAHVRVFANGDLVAYRNSREWFVRQSTEALVESIRESDRVVAEHLLDLAAAMSSFHNPQRHGGFIIWTRGEELDGGVKLEQLHPGEPQRLFGNTGWITERDLLTRRDGELGDDGGVPAEKVTWDLNHAVAQQVLKASERDGALWLCGPSCRVKKFGMRVHAGEVRLGDGANIGTKRRTAEDVVQAGKGDTIAVTVSSDGPVKLMHLPEGAHDVVAVEMFQAIETSERTMH